MDLHEPSSEKQRVEPSVLIPKALLRVGGSGIKCLLSTCEVLSSTPGLHTHNKRNQQDVQQHNCHPSTQGTEA